MSVRELLTALDRFNSDPGGLREQLSFVVADGGQIPAQGLQTWSDFISNELDQARERNGETLTNYGPRHQFFNILKQTPDSDAVEQDITWTAFPRIVKLHSVGDRQRWRRADSSRDTQDEYCEWSVTRDPGTDKITRVTFTSEGPEYWDCLARLDQSTVARLYQQHVSGHVKESDLFRGNTYDPRNQWNNSTTNGAMHLIQRNNTLLAEIELAAGASMVRRKSGSFITDAQELIACSAYGAAERNSDPHIGALVNELALKKADITFSNPIGLCIAGLSVAGWETPDASNARHWAR